MYYTCAECLIKIKYCYEFWKQCIKSKNILYSYIFDLKNSGELKNSIESNITVLLTDIEYRKHKQKINTPLKTEVKDEDEDSDTQSISDEDVKKKEEPIVAILADEDEDKFMKLVDNFSYLVDELEQYDKVNVVVDDTDIKQDLNDDDEEDDDDDEDAMYIDLEDDPDKNNCDNGNLNTKKPVGNLLNNVKNGIHKNNKINFLPMNECAKNEDGNYQCTICLKQLPTLYNLEKHKLIHSTTFPLKCPYCQKKFTYIKYVLLHENAYIEEKYKCVICYKILCSPTSFEKHKRYHELVFKCNDCHQNFLSSRSLKEHRQMKHNISSQKQKFSVNSIKKTSRKNFTCLTCGKKFKDKAILEKHEQQHTEIYKCEMCQLNFKDASMLNAHMNTTHFLDNNLEEIKTEDHIEEELIIGFN